MAEPADRLASDEADIWQGAGQLWPSALVLICVAGGLNYNNNVRRNRAEWPVLQQNAEPAVWKSREVMKKLAVLVLLAGCATGWLVTRAPDGSTKAEGTKLTDTGQMEITDTPSAETTRARAASLEDGSSTSDLARTASPTVIEALYSAPDLLLFLEAWEVSAAHDPEVALAVGKAMKECAVLGVAGEARFRTLFKKVIEAYPDSATKIESAISRTMARCSELVRMRKLEHLDAGAHFLDMAAAGGNAEAQAMRLEKYLAEKGVIETRERMMRLLDPTRPETLVAMSDFANLNADRLFPPGSLLNQIQGNQWALILAACELGYNCSASSQYLQSACLGHVPCNFNSVQDWIRTVFVSPLHYEQQRQLAARIAEEIKFGRAAGLFDP